MEREAGSLVDAGAGQEQAAVRGVVDEAQAPRTRSTRGHRVVRRAGRGLNACSS